MLGYVSITEHVLVLEHDVLMFRYTCVDEHMLLTGYVRMAESLIIMC